MSKSFQIEKANKKTTRNSIGHSSKTFECTSTAVFNLQGRVRVIGTWPKPLSNRKQQVGTMLISNRKTQVGTLAKAVVNSTNIEATCADIWCMSVVNKHNSPVRIALENFISNQIWKDISKRNIAIVVVVAAAAAAVVVIMFPVKEYLLQILHSKLLKKFNKNILKRSSNWCVYT